MFSPDATVIGSRNTRRRQRTTSEDSVTTRQIPKRRKRSSLAPDTFEQPSALKSIGQTRKVSGGRAPSKEYQLEREGSVETTASLAVRSKGSKRGDRERRSTKQADGIVQVALSCEG